MGLALDLVSMVEFVMEPQVYYDLVHYIFLFIVCSRRWRYIACSC